MGGIAARVKQRARRGLVVHPDAAARRSTRDTVPGALDALDAGRRDYHRRIVHYVEDNETNVEVMRGILAQRPQVQLDVSATGLDGLAAIRARPPHLILLDMHLPDIERPGAAAPPEGRPDDGRRSRSIVVSADATAARRSRRRSTPAPTAT